MSSITYKLFSSANFIILSISAVCPNRWTGIIALVFDVIALDILSTSILKVSISTSTNTGFNPSNAMTSTLEAKVKSVVITSSPCFKSNAIKATCKASVPFAHGIT